MTLSVAIAARMRALLVTSLDHGEAKALVELDASLALADGVAADQSDKLFSDRRTLAASANEELDLSGGVTDAFGATISFVEITAILILASPANTNAVRVGETSATPFLAGFGASTHRWDIAPGDFLFASCRAAGWGIANGASDKLRIANAAGGSSVTYDIMIAGRSA